MRTFHMLRSLICTHFKGVTLICALLAGPALQAQESPASAPPDILAQVPQSRWAGQAKMTYFAFDVYNATLWVGPGFRAADYAQHAFALDLAYLRKLDGREIAKRSLAEMKRAGTFTDTQGAAWLDAMTAAFPDVRAGDRITGIHKPGIGAQFLINGKSGARIDDPLFARLFFGIWLAETTSEPKLRLRLLGQLPE